MLDRRHLLRNIIYFALPLMASGIVQQSFNSVDVAVVGRYVGADALAAVGSNGPVIGLIVNLFIGIAVGANVVIATYIGQRNKDNVQRAVATTALLALVTGAFLLILGQLVARPILSAIDTPPQILDLAAEYLRIYAYGFPSMLVYNFGSAILRSVGDTKRPFYWLVAGGVVNVVLDLSFVTGFDMGVAGVAAATSIANTVSAAGIAMTLIRRKDEIHLDPRKIRAYGPQTRKILSIGLPAGLQGMVFSLSNVFILSAINSFGPTAMAGSAAALNFEMYSYFVLSAFVQAGVAFISQNYGAGNYAMCKSVYRRCLFLAMGTCATVNMLIVIFSEPCLNIFTSDASVIAVAQERIYTVLAFQWLAAIYEVSSGALRALGYSMLPTILIILGTCVVRVGWVMLAPFESFIGLLRVYPITWVITATAVFTAWLFIARRHLTSGT